ncbi:hypothetical protein TNCV_285931 [Trichonephila clavipes]|nr:hypothetical protein TNCV_285931 [Trichonephila clavipes]
MHNSLSTRTIQRRLQQSGMSTRRPLLRLPLTGNQQVYAPQQLTVAPHWSCTRYHGTVPVYPFEYGLGDQWPRKDKMDLVDKLRTSSVKGAFRSSAPSAHNEHKSLLPGNFRELYGAEIICSC